MKNFIFFTGISIIASVIATLFCLLIAHDSSKTVDINTSTLCGHEHNCIKNAPHQVSVQYCGRHMCSGSIIAKDWIITAAHCVQKSKCCYSIRAGTLHHDKNGSIHTVKKIVMHEHFSNHPNGLTDNDIALINIAEPFVIDSTRQPITLVNINSVILPGSRITMYSWGNITSDVQSIIKVYRTKIINKIACNMTYEKYYGIYDNEGCADNSNSKTPLYFNDAGGPIIHGGHLAGILSWTGGCGHSNCPSVFTEISAHRLWIHRHSGV